MLRHSSILLFLVFALLVVSRSPARAQDGDYKALTTAAVEEHALGHYEEARALFAKAHALNPNARTLWGMGTAAFEARQYVDAIRFLQEAMQDSRKPLTASQRKQTEALLKRAADYVVRVRVEVVPADAQLAVDGTPVSPDVDRIIMLDAGSHQVVARAEGYEELARAVRWAAGEATLELHLNPIPSRAPLVQEQVAPAPPPAEPKRVPVEKTRAFKPLKWVALGATVASLGVAFAGYGLREAEATKWNDDDKCPPDKQLSCPSTRAAVDKWQTMAIAGGAAAGAFAVLSVVFFVLDHRAAKDAARANLACAPFGAGPGLSCHYRY